MHAHSFDYFIAGVFSIIIPNRKNSLHSMSHRETGTVIHFNAIHGHGTIRRQNGDTIIVRYSSIRAEGYRELEEGERVEFSIGQGARGLQAEDVLILE
jgi:CspA family cold shock protein